MPVLLTGETGTGKEVAARLLHEWSARRARRFVPINCAAIPNELIEAELFGYAKGAFTGSVRAYDGQLDGGRGRHGLPRRGRRHAAAVPGEAAARPRGPRRQPHRRERVAGRRLPHPGRDQPRSRSRCARRARSAPISTSGWRSSRSGCRRCASASPICPRWSRHFARRFYREEPEATARHEVEGATPAALAALCAYPWPGNIRELRNVIFEALVHKRAGSELLLSDLPRAGAAPRGRRHRRPGAAPARATARVERAGGRARDRGAALRSAGAVGDAGARRARGGAGGGGRQRGGRGAPARARRTRRRARSGRDRARHDAAAGCRASREPPRHAPASALGRAAVPEAPRGAHAVERRRRRRRACAR